MCDGALIQNDTDAHCIFMLANNPKNCVFIVATTIHSTVCLLLFMYLPFSFTYEIRVRMRMFVYMPVYVCLLNMCLRVLVGWFS